MSKNDKLTAIELALAAYEQKKQDRAKQDLLALERTEKKAHEAFVHMFGIEPDLVTGPYITSGDLQVFHDYNWEWSEHMWRVAVDCPGCGDKMWSRKVYHLDDIGALIAEPNAKLCDECDHSANEGRQTAMEKLFFALQEVVKELIDAEK